MAEPGALITFYGTEAEQYTFYRIPKVLFTDPGFRRITADAKILYGLMLDRMGLSIRNGWLDEQERVFIYFTLEETMDAMCCGHNKAVSLFTELDKVGLIERKKQGQGRPTKKSMSRTLSGKRKSRLPKTGSLHFPKPELLTSENRTQSILIRIRLIGTILIHLSIRRRSLRRIDRLRRLMRWIRYGPIGIFEGEY